MSQGARRLLIAVLAAAAGLTLAACGGGGSSSAKASGRTSSTTATTEVSTTAGTTATTGAQAPTTTGAGGTGCGFSQLTVSSSSQGAAGHIGVVVVFTNKSATTCTLTGYPGVAGLNSSGQQAVQATRTPSGYMGGISGTTPPTVTLAPGGTASALIEGSDVPQGNESSCPTYPSLLITPPNTTQSVTISQSMPGCAEIQVHPVVAGPGGGAG